VAKLIIENKGRLHLAVRDRIMNMFIRKGMRRGDPVPTYRDLSRQLKVSLVTIQRAMNELTSEGLVAGRPGKGSFLAKEINRAGRKLTQVGLFFYCSRQRIFHSDYLSQIFRGVMLRCEELGADTRIFSIKSEGVLTPKEIAESGVDGVVLCAVVNNEYLMSFVDQELPTVVADHYAPDVPLDYVAVDNESAAHRAVDHLVELGHRRIAYLNGYSTDTVAAHKAGVDKDPIIESSDVIERREGYLAAMRRHGLEDEVTVFPATAQGGAVKGAMAAIDKMDRRPTAILTYDAVAVRSFVRGFEELGLRVPGDVSVVGTVGASDLVVDQRTVTLSRTDFMEMGRKAVDLLAARCQKPRAEEAEVARIPCEFCPGTTSGPLDPGRK
jgi:DNA-binding LacI/PurR family transcriptional regulator